VQQFLSPYEADQVDQISSWLSERPSTLEAAIRTVTAPLSWLISHVMPNIGGGLSVEHMERLAARRDGCAQIARAAGVADVSELRHHRLEECDALAQEVSYVAERESLIEGLAFTAVGMVGPITSFIADSANESVELLCALRAITRIGHCYGYPLNRPVDLKTVEAVLDIAMLSEPAQRVPRVKQLHDLLDGKVVVPKDAVDRTVEKDYREVEGEISAAEYAPEIGEELTIWFDYHFAHQVDITARRIFQERWLRDNGKVTSIPASPKAHRRTSFQEVYEMGGQMAFLGGGTLGFVVTLPVALVGRLFRGVDNAAVRGFRDGYTDANGTVRRLTGGPRAGRAPVAVRPLPAPF
jgi:hypothetical protein